MLEDDNKGIKQTKEDYGSLFDFGESKPESGQTKEAVSINNSFGSLEKKVSEDTYNPIDEKAEHEKYLSQMLLLSFNGAKKKKKKKVFISIFVVLVFIFGITFGVVKFSLNAFYDNFMVPKEYIEEFYTDNNYSLLFHMDTTYIMTTDNDSYNEGVRDVYIFTYELKAVTISYYESFEDAYNFYYDNYDLTNPNVICKGNAIINGKEESLALLDLSHKEIWEMYNRMIDDGIEIVI